MKECLPRECELHVHIGGCFHLEDLFDMGREVYGDVDWTLFKGAHDRFYPDSSVDPLELFRTAVREGSAEPLRRHYIHGETDGPDFGRFMTKMNLMICLYRHWRDVLGRESDLVRLIVDRHRAEGLRYVEYRSTHPGGASADPRGFMAFHGANARILKKESTSEFTANYIISIPREEPLVGYNLVRRLLADNPDLRDTIVGLDFCNVEEGYPPKSARLVFEHLRNDNDADPQQHLDIVYHVGEIYFDKSLESAVRWCHEAAELGARRIGHAIALGLDPQVSLARRPAGHETEMVSERLDQIDYDLRHAEALTSCGVTIDESELERERDQLRSKDKRGAIRRPYSVDLIAQIRLRQDFALSTLEQLGTVI